MKCPNCGAEQADGLAECQSCQVVFAKWAAKTARERAARQTPVPAAQAADPGTGIMQSIAIDAAQRSGIEGIAPLFIDTVRGKREYAGYLRRIPAKLLDGFFLMVLFVAARAVLRAEGPETGLLMLLNLFYCIGLECSPLQGTLGKKLLGLSVIDTAGGRISVFASMKRYFLMPVWMFWVWIHCAFACLTGNKKLAARRMMEKPFLHDRLAGTLVVK